MSMVFVSFTKYMYVLISNMGTATSLTGYLLLILSCISFSILTTWMVGAKLLWKAEENSFLQFFQEDNYYCFLLPMMLPTTVVLIYANWVSMKFFRHN